MLNWLFSIIKVHNPHIFFSFFFFFFRFLRLFVVCLFVCCLLVCIFCVCGGGGERMREKLLPDKPIKPVNAWW